MKTQAIIEMMTTKVKSILQNHSEQLEQLLGIENAEDVIKIIGQAVTQAAAERLKTYLENNEIRENTVTHQGQKYHFSRTNDKSFHTSFGKIVLKRRLYQNQEGQSFVPLDHAWNMEHQFATVEVREAVLYVLALMPANEAHPLFEKCTHFQMASQRYSSRMPPREFARKSTPISYSMTLKRSLIFAMQQITCRMRRKPFSEKAIPKATHGTNRNGVCCLRTLMVRRRFTVPCCTSKNSIVVRRIARHR